MFRHYPRSLRIKTRFGQINIQFYALGSSRVSRHLMLSLFRGVKPILKYLNHVEGDDWYRKFRPPNGGALLAPDSLMGFHFRARRLTLGWTLKRLGQETGIPYSKLSLIERGLHHPSLKSVKKIETALKIEG